MAADGHEGLVADPGSGSEGVGRAQGAAQPPAGGDRGRSVVYSVRLTPEQTDEIRRLAQKAGVTASALVREWVLQGLAAERETPSLGSLLVAISRDLDKLRRNVGRL